MDKTTYIFLFTLKDSQLNQELAEELAQDIVEEIKEHTLGEEEVELGAVVPVIEKE